MTFEAQTVAAQSQGVQLTKPQELVRYWGIDYEWRTGRRYLTGRFSGVHNWPALDVHRGSPPASRRIHIPAHQQASKWPLKVESYLNQVEDVQ